MSNYLAIGVYPKGDKRAGVVFRKNKGILYRITTVERADQFVSKMYEYAMDLKNKREKPDFLVELNSPRKRSHVLEIAISGDKVELRVYEMVEGCAKLRFNWRGAREGLFALMNDIGVMRLVMRF